MRPHNVRSTVSRSVAPHKAAYSKPTCCFWPECNATTWAEVDLPVCQFHAAKIHLRVAEQIPVASVRSGRAERQELWYAREGRVYIARAGALYKIGFSTDVAQRMRSLGAVLVASHTGTLDDERDLHARFHAHREYGEYFRPSPELDALIAEWLDKRTEDGAESESVN